MTKGMVLAGIAKGMSNRGFVIFRAVLEKSEVDMQGPNGFTGELLEAIMARLRKANVLREDEPNHPTHYNRAWSAVLEAINVTASTRGTGIPDTKPIVEFASVPIPTIPEKYVPYVPNDLGNYRPRKR